MRVSTCWPRVVLQCWSHARPIKGLFNCRTCLYYVPDQIIMNHVVSCPAGNNLWKIRLVILHAFLGLLHTSAGFECGRCWPYMDVLTSTWLQLSPISIPTSASVPVGRPSNWTCCNLIWHSHITPS